MYITSLEEANHVFWCDYSGLESRQVACRVTVIERPSQHHLNTSHKVPLTAATTDYSPYTVSRTGAMNNSGTVFQRELVMMGDYICVQRTIIGQPLKLIKSFCQFEEFGGIPGRIKRTFAFKTANIRLRRVASPGGRCSFRVHSYLLSCTVPDFTLSCCLSPAGCASSR